MNFKIKISKKEIKTINELSNKLSKFFLLSLATDKNNFTEEKKVLKKIEKVLLELSNYYSISDDLIVDKIEIISEDEELDFKDENEVLNLILDYKNIICDYNSNIKEIYFEEI